MAVDWTVGVAPNQRLRGVCKKCFQNVYNVSHGSLDTICREIKDGVRNADAPLNDNTAARSNPKFITHMRNVALSYKINLSAHQISAMCIPKTIASLNTFAWMASFFDSVGDAQPTCGEIHLDPESTQTIYNEYKELMTSKGQVQLLCC